jgi:uncharacterized glyoxalase superfamily protein PhnB
MPACPVIPVLAYDDVGEAIGWLCETFGFVERWRVGNHRAQLAIGDAGVAVTGGRSTSPAATRPGELGYSVMVRVEEVDAHHEQARRRGARILALPADFPYGERQYTAEDLGGYRWTFSESIADVAPEDWGGRSAAPG